MSTNHRRRQYSASYSAGTSALAASGLRPGPLQPVRLGGRLRSTGRAPYPSAPEAFVDAPASKALEATASVRTTCVPLPGNVVELYANSVGPGFFGPRSVGSCSAVYGAGRAPSKPRRTARLMCSEAGMATAEYAIATLAAVGFAGLLVFILRSDEVRGFLLNLIRTALALP